MERTIQRDFAEVKTTTALRQRSNRPAFLSDQILFVSVIILVAFGLLMIYSTTTVVAEEKIGDAYYYVKRQASAVFIGSTLLLITSYINLEKCRKYTHLLFPVSLLLLSLVFIPGLGLRAGGALRWIGMGPLRFQPVEIVKIFFVFFLAGYVAKNDQRLAQFKYGVLIPFISLGLLSALLLAQPDFGSAAVLSLLTVGIIFACGGSLRFIFGGGGLLLLGAAFLIVFSPYRLRRVFGFLDPFKDSSGQGYQLIQSLIAIGNGGVSGVGIGESQQKLFFLPAAHNDFIFAVIAEELGFIGSAALLALFLIILWRGLVISLRFIDDTFYFALGLGLTMLLTMPAFLNMAVALGLLPTKGLALPFISYGGSHLIVTLLASGLLLAIARTSLRLPTKRA